MQPFSWLAPIRLEEAVASPVATVADAMVSPAGAHPTPGNFFKAGGIDILSLVKSSLLSPQALIDLRRIPGLDRIMATAGGGVRIGALTTLATLARHSVIASRYGSLADAARGAGNLQIRNVATIAGNLLQRPRCWYFRSQHHHCLKKGGNHCFALSGENQYHAIFDNQPCAIVHPSAVATVIVAMGGTLELRGAAGPRRVALEDFLTLPHADPYRENDLKPHEILAAIHLPPSGVDTHTTYLKLSEKGPFDWPLADVAVSLEIASSGVCKRAAIVLGAAAPVPHRASSAENLLVGQVVNEASAREAGVAALAGATPLAKNRYKLALFEALVYRAILRAANASAT